MVRRSVCPLQVFRLFAAPSNFETKWAREIDRTRRATRQQKVTTKRGIFQQQTALSIVTVHVANVITKTNPANQTELSPGRVGTLIKRPSRLCGKHTQADDRHGGLT